MKIINTISVCKTDCDSETFKIVKDEKGNSRKVLAYHKVTRKGWGMYVELTTLPNGKKVSVTKHGKIPKK